jgi:hypothetical protein
MSAHFPKVIKVLFLGPDDPDVLPHQGYPRAVELIREEWKQPTYGIVRLVRLVLITLALASPILIVDQAVNSQKPSVLALAREAYYLARALFLFGVLFSQLYKSQWVVAIVIYFVCDIVVHLAGGALVWGKYSIDPRRSLLLALLNYAELTAAFSIFYLHTSSLTWTNLVNPVEALYFSLATSTTVGYGDVHPANACGQKIAMAQLSIFVIFVALFITTFLSRIPTEVRRNSGGDSGKEAKVPVRKDPAVL